MEVFFAKQAPQTGIKPHTDFTNFIMTSHLGLDCPPPPQSWQGGRCESLSFYFFFSFF